MNTIAKYIEFQFLLWLSYALSLIDFKSCTILLSTTYNFKHIINHKN